MTHRQRCYGCYRPRESCFCKAIPSIANRTEVLILQHMRERFHPFNTARIVHRALRNSTLLVDHNHRLADAAERFPFRPGAGVLYPAPGAKVLSDLPPEQQPSQLVVIDGTWHHAKTLMRDIPAIQRLPRYCLQPSEPSRYRIRREPTETALSTIEATTQALQAIEPETNGWQALLAAFETMVDQQIQQMGAADQRRVLQSRRALSNPNLPRVLLDNDASVVVAYGESASSFDRANRMVSEPDMRLPVFWTAQRLGTKQAMRCAIEPVVPLSASVLSHLKLREADFERAHSVAAFRDAWQAFLRPGDTLVVYHQSTARLLTAAGLPLPPCLTLKSIQWESMRPRGTLEELLQQIGVPVADERVDGQCRADQRLDNAIRLICFLQARNRAAP